MIKWKAIKWNSKIQRIECTRETESRVFGSDGRGGFWDAQQMSDQVAYFDTWEEARAHLLRDTERDIIDLSRQIGLAYSKTAEIKLMSAPRKVTK